jgi:hypothetical protein
LPLLEGALVDGRVTTGHVDAVGRVTRGLDEPGRVVVHGREVELVDLAVSCSPEVFERELQRQVRNLMRDDGVDELTRQQRATRLRIWLDHDSGMYQLRGVFDPLTGLAIRNRLDHTMRTLFSEQPPDTSPDDALEKIDHLRGLAAARVLSGGAVVDRPDDLILTGGGYELTVLIDEHTLRGGRHPHTVIDADEPGVQLPAETIRRIACSADIIPIILDDNGVPLRLGRTTRLASRAQRRALRAMYPTCAIPGCQVPSRYCQPHHVQWWRHHGHTNLENLLPLCSRHHHHVHEGQSTLTLQPDHSLTITHPDGTTEHVPPPRQRRQSDRQPPPNTGEAASATATTTTTTTTSTEAAGVRPLRPASVGERRRPSQPFSTSATAPYGGKER